MRRLGPNLGLLLLSAVAVTTVSGWAQQVSSDNGDGTFTNPVIPADYPDPDVIRVGDDYYMVSSDFHSVPGDPILHSRDLVNWHIIGHSISYYDSDAQYNMEAGTRYGLGSWAPSLRYHDGTFYVLYNTNDHGAYISRATNPAGPWITNALHVTLYDPGLFFDDDGRVWVVSGQVVLSLTELTPDLRGVKSPPRVIYQGAADHYDEGSHVYKRNGYYYILTATSRADLPTKFALQIERATSLSGPFETKIIFTDDANWKSAGLHQGGFVQTQNGDWWALIFQGRFDFGREPTLQPVHWVDDWPVVGVNGRAVITYKKPDIATDLQPIAKARLDTFDQYKLGPEWEWNHNPDNRMWTLRERPGFLRLKTTSVTQTWKTARNTLWQRLVEGGQVTVTAALDISGMRDGDIAGLGMFQVGTSSICVTENHERKIVVRNEDQIVAQDSVPIKQSNIWLRLQVPEFEARTQYFYSLNGKQFVPLGKPQPMLFREPGVWIGERVSLFNYATKALGGHVDIDSFLYEIPDHTNLFQAESRIDAQKYDEVDKGHVQWIHDPAAKRESTKINGSNQMAVGSFDRGGWIKFNRVDFGEGIADLKINLAATGNKEIEVRLDSLDGPLIAKCTARDTGGPDEYKTQICPTMSEKGTHALYFVFEDGGDAATALAWFTFGAQKGVLGSSSKH
jgi:beta-xylosidase